MENIIFYTLYTINNTDIHYPDIYFTPEYGKACEFSDNAEWELCRFKDLIYVYLKRSYAFDRETYYDLISPYGYSGYYFEKQETLNEFVPLFREEARKRNYLTEVIRQNPYVFTNISNISKHYDRIISRITFGIKIDQYKSFDEYLKDTHRDNKRGYKIALHNSLIFKMEDFNEENLNKFITIYNLTMDKLNSTKYYYFNQEYYYSLFHLKENIFFANVYNKSDLIASCMVFKYNKLLHYHLGGSLLEHRHMRPNNLIHCSIIQYGIENNYELYHLGGGLKDNDTLFEFKNKIADIKFHYTIYKNILNEEIYDKIKKSYIEHTYFPIHRK
jgi:serine/alanine adding enzyme